MIINDTPWFTGAHNTYLHVRKTFSDLIPPPHDDDDDYDDDDNNFDDHLLSPIGAGPGLYVYVYVQATILKKTKLKKINLRNSGGVLRNHIITE